MMTTFVIPLNERAVVMRGGLPVRALAPGRHTVFGFGLTVCRFVTDALVFDAPAEVRAVMPADWFGELDLATHQRAVLFRDGRPVRFLGPGVHRFFKVDATVHADVYDVREPTPALTAELLAVIPRAELVDVTVRAHERGLVYVSGRLEGMLGPGRHTRWTSVTEKVEVQVVDLRVVQTVITGQELMTRDKVTLRLTLTVEHALADPVLAAQAVENPRDALYLATQLACRELVAGLTLDELLGGRDALTKALVDDVAAKALAFGVHVARVGLKDVILPGEMKTLMNRVIEAEKEAAANVILRREETAATRALANTAKIMAESPLLLRLKELETLKAMAESIDEVRLVVGADGVSKLLPTGLLGGADKA